MIKKGAQCSNEEKKKFMDFFQEFHDVFSWSYEDLFGCDPNIIQHSIPVKEWENPIRKRQRHVNPTLEATIRKEVEKILNAHIIFPIKYFEWVLNLVLI